MRWEFEQALTERQDKSVSGFDLGYTQPFEATAQTNLTAILSKLDATDPLKTTFGLTSISSKGGLLFAGKDTGTDSITRRKTAFYHVWALPMHTTTRRYFEVASVYSRVSWVSDAAM